MAYRIELKHPIADPFAILGGETAVEEHLRIDIPATGGNAAQAAERGHLILLAEAAIRHTIDMTGRSPVTGEAIVHTNTVPQRMELPFRATALTAAEYLKDGASTYSDLGLANFGLHGSTAPALLFSRNSFTDPGDVELDNPLPLRFTFTTAADSEVSVIAVADDPDTVGTDETVAEASQVSRVFQLCALLFLSHLYENRQAVAYSTSKAIEVPLAFKHLVRSIARIR